MHAATVAPAPRPSASRLPLPAPERLLLILLVFVPLAALADWLDWGAVIVFAFAGLAIVPLAGLMGGATERLSTRLGAGLGGLLNATFGNAAELILALVALHQGLFDMVKASLTGSIIGNVLLVLGGSILLGGLGREKQAFDRAAAAAGSTLLALAAVGLVVPAVFHLVADAAVQGATLTPDRETAAEHSLSLLIAIVLFGTYLMSLVFSLKTHRHLYAGQVRAAHEPAGPAMSVRRAALTLAIATG